MADKSKKDRIKKRREQREALGDRKFIAMIPWTVKSDGSKYIDMGNDMFMTPNTNIEIISKLQYGKIVADDVKVIVDDESGVLFYGKTNAPKLIAAINGQYLGESRGYTVGGDAGNIESDIEDNKDT